MKQRVQSPKARPAGRAKRAASTSQQPSRRSKRAEASEPEPVEDDDALMDIHHDADEAATANATTAIDEQQGTVADDNDDDDGDDDDEEEPRWRKSSRAAAKRAFERIEHDIDIFEHLNDLGEEVSTTDDDDDNDDNDDEAPAPPKSRRRATKRTGTTSKRTGTGRVTKRDKMLAAQAERRQQRMKRTLVDTSAMDACMPPYQSPSKTDPNLGPLRVMELHTAIQKRIDAGAISGSNQEPQLKPEAEALDSIVVLPDVVRGSFGATACLGLNSVALQKGARGFKLRFDGAEEFETAILTMETAASESRTHSFCQLGFTAAAVAASTVTTRTAYAAHLSSLTSKCWLVRACGEPYHRVTVSGIDIMVVCPALAQLTPKDTVSCVVKDGSLTVLINNTPQDIRFTLPQADAQPPTLKKRGSSRSKKSTQSKAEAAMSLANNLVVPTLVTSVAKTVNLGIAATEQLFPAFVPPLPKKSEYTVKIMGDGGFGIPKTEVALRQAHAELLARAQACGAVACNRLVFDAVEQGDFRLLQALEAAVTVVPSLAAPRWPSYGPIPLQVAAMQNDVSAVSLLAHAATDGRVDMPSNSIMEDADTGKVGNNTYFHRVGKVGVARGGKEGNTAFVVDPNSTWDYEPHAFRQQSHQARTFFRHRHLSAEVRACMQEELSDVKNTMTSFGLFMAAEAGNSVAAEACLAALRTASFGVTYAQEMAIDNSLPIKNMQQRQIMKKMTSSNSITALHLAAALATESRFKKLLSLAGMDVNAADEVERSVIHYAAVNPYGDAVLKQLLSMQANPEAQDKKHVTPLHMAARFGTADAVRTLIEALQARQADMNQAMGGGKTENNDDDGDGIGNEPAKKKTKAQLLKAFDESFGLVKDRRGHTPLHYAAFENNLEAIRVFHSVKADMEVLDREKNTPLHVACLGGHLDTVKFLVEECQVNLEAPNKRRYTPLAIAAKNGHVAVVQYLLRMGHAVDVKDSSGNSPVHFAAAFGWLECLQMLHAYGADLNVTSSWMTSPLSISVTLGSVQCMHYLLKQDKVDVSLVDKAGRGLLHEACRQVTPAIPTTIKALLAHDADPNLQDLQGNTPMHLLCSVQIKDVSGDQLAQQLAAAKLLLDAKATLASHNHADQTPLMRAFKTANMDLVKFLLSASHATSSDGTETQSFLHQLFKAGEKESIVDCWQLLISRKEDHDDVRQMLTVCHLETGLTPLHQLFAFVASLGQAFRSDETTVKVSVTSAGTGYYRHQLQTTTRVIRRAGTLHDPTFVQRVLGDCIKLGFDLNTVARLPDVERLKTMFDTKFEAYNKIPHYQRHNMPEVVSFEDMIKKANKVELGVGATAYWDQEKIAAEKSNMAKPSDVVDVCSHDKTKLALKNQQQICNYEHDVSMLVPHGGCTLLHMLCQVWDPLDLVDMALKGGATLDATDAMGQTAVMYAIDAGLSAVVEVFLNSDPGVVNIASSITSQTAVILAGRKLAAAKPEHLEARKACLAAVLAAEPDPTHCTLLNETAWAYACYKAHSLTVCQCLLNAGTIDPNLGDGLGTTPLQSAIMRGYQDIAKALLANAHVNVNQPGRGGETALHMAVSCSAFSSYGDFVVERGLLNREADATLLDAMQRTLLHRCFVDHDHPTTRTLAEPTGSEPVEIVSDLFDVVHPPVNAQDTLGRTALHYAALGGAIVTAKYLLQRGADANIQDSDGNDVFQLAVIGGQVHFAAFIIDELKSPHGTVHYAALVKGDKDSDEADSYVTQSTSNFGLVAKRGYVGLAYLLMDRGQPVQAAFTDAILVGAHQLAATLLRKSTQNEVKGLVDEEGNTLLGVVAHASTSTKYLVMLTERLVADFGYKYNCQNDQHETLLHRASRRGLLPLMEHLLEHCAVAAKDVRGMDAFAHLFSNKIVRPSAARVLLENGADVNSWTQVDQAQVAASLPHTRAKYIVQSPQERILLALASVITAPMLKSLESIPAELKARQGWIKTQPSAQLLELAVLLLEAKASWSTCSAAGLPIFSTLTKDSSIRLVGLKYIHQLAQACNNPVDLAVTSKHGLNSLHALFVDWQNHFAFRDAADVVEWLVETGISVNAVVTAGPHKGQTALDMALRCADPVTLAMLKKCKAHTKKADAMDEREDVSFRPEAPAAVDVLKESQAGLDLVYQERIAQDPEAGVPKVDPPSKLEKVGRVMEMPAAEWAGTETEYYDATLTKTDVAYGWQGQHDFYRLQVIHNHVQGLYILYTRWGRISEEGQHQNTPFASGEAAASEFEKVFKSKTGTLWSSRHQFEPKAGKYYLQSLESETIAEQQVAALDIVKLTKADQQAASTELSPAVVALLWHVFNVDGLESAIVAHREVELPFGVSSREAVEKAMTLLRSMRSIVLTMQTMQGAERVEHQALLQSLVDLANEFYTKVPVAVTQRLTTPRTVAVIDELMDKVNRVYVQNVAAQLLLAAHARHAKTKEAKIPYLLQHLGSRVEQISAGTDCYRTVYKQVQSVNSSYLETHTLELLAINRAGEDEAFKMFASDGNRQLLWHGTNSANVPGILQQGLRSAPPSAHAHGHMFGKGVYFADVFTKSLGYASSYGEDTEDDRYTCMFLCEVALGNSDARTAANAEPPQGGCHSILGLGNQVPSVALRTHDGIKIPMGPLMAGSSEAYLGYNEYIVFQAERIRLCYLALFKAKSTMS